MPAVTWRALGFVRLATHKEAIGALLSGAVDLSIDAAQGTLTRELEANLRWVSVSA